MHPTQRGIVRGVLAVVAAIGFGVSAASCGGGSSSTSSAPPSTQPPSTPACPSAGASPSASGPGLTKALQSMPFDLPLPSGMTIVSTMTTSDGIHVVRFTTTDSLRTAVLFIVEKYPKAGYQIGRGDAEATEADAPWVHGQVRGLTRVNEVQPCQTEWLVASVATTSSGVTSQILVPHPTSSVTSALPFG
ncbi:MAG TPA: hypothetical protein VFH54_08160 [Mycobacteriales bacterium]|nr:hypothetical protein [Mycobacteriales bacterium]